METTMNENLADWLSRQTGISLRRLALWLGIDQSVLTRWRQQERLPPADALLQLVDAWKTLQALPEPALEANPTEAEAARYSRLADEWAWKAQLLDQQVAMHKKQHLQALRALQWVAHLRQTHPNPPAKLARWLDETTWQAEKTLAAHGPGVWKVLETESEGYRFGAARFAALAAGG
jgi:hypothetical protein